MTQLLSQVSESIAQLVANAAPILTAIRVGQNRHVSGFLWRNDIVVTSDQALPAASGYTIVLSNGALISAQPGPRDPVNNLAALRLDGTVAAAAPEPSPDTTIGALVLVLGADFDGSATVRLTSVHSFPRNATAGTEIATITLDLAATRVSHGGVVLDATGRLLGMISASPSGDAVVVPHRVIARFVGTATPHAVPEDGGTAPMPPNMTFTATHPIPLVASPAPAESVPRDEPAQSGNGTSRGWLGVSLQPITVPEGLVHRAGQRTARQVVGVTRGGPADRAGLRPGDVLLALDGSSTSGDHALRSFLQPERIGNQVRVRIMRDGLVQTTVLTIGAQPE